MNHVNFTKRHIVSLHDLNKQDLLKILSIAHKIEHEPQPDLLSGFLMATLFFEPSTRTRLSFEAAMSRLGGRVIGFADANSTSAKKGESLADTIRMASTWRVRSGLMRVVLRRVQESLGVLGFRSQLGENSVRAWCYQHRWQFH